MKAFVDRNRKRNGKAAINYPQPTELQKQKLNLKQYDAHREMLFAAKGKGGKGGSAQAGRPPAANAHSAPSTEVEQQLDEGLAWGGSRKCAESFESQLPSKSREVQIRVSHTKCRSE